MATGIYLRELDRGRPTENLNSETLFEYAAKHKKKEI